MVNLDLDPDNLPFIEGCFVCGRIAFFSLMHPTFKTLYVCSDHIATHRGERAVFRLTDGESVGR